MRLGIYYIGIGIIQLIPLFTMIHLKDRGKEKDKEVSISRYLLEGIAQCCTDMDTSTILTVGLLMRSDGRKCKSL